MKDIAVPVGFEPQATTETHSDSMPWRQSIWTEAELGKLGSFLADDSIGIFDHLDSLHLLEVWNEAVSEWLDEHSALRKRLDPFWCSRTGFHPRSLQVAIETVLEGLSGEAAKSLWQQARSRRFRGRYLLVSLASNLPGLFFQPLAVAMALRCPVLFKTPSLDPLSVPALLDTLFLLEPQLKKVLASLTWTGGDPQFESAFFSTASHLFAYGGEQSTRAIESRFAGDLNLFGPRFSVALTTEDLDSEAAEALARDIALFDQRGCLSVQTVLTTRDPIQLADRLVQALEGIVHELPPGSLDPQIVAQCQHLRMLGSMNGAFRGPRVLEHGTVLIWPDTPIPLSPGGRTVFIQALQGPDHLLNWVKNRRDQLQGIALHGEEARRLSIPLQRMNLSRVTALGQIQKTDFAWKNGGKSALELLSAPESLSPESR